MKIETKNFYEMVNKDKSIRTNYNNQYKRRLKRLNSKPNISRTYKISLTTGISMNFIEY